MMNCVYDEFHQIFNSFEYYSTFTKCIDYDDDDDVTMPWHMAIALFLRFTKCDAAQFDYDSIVFSTFHT